MTDFKQEFTTAYGFDAPSIEVGHAMLEGNLLPDCTVKIPLSMMNRHGLIAGSTGTGKTRTLQLLAESLSLNGVPSFVADVKGDLSGLAKPGIENPRIMERLTPLGRTFTPRESPVEFFSLTGNNGTQLRATVSSFGPVLLGKILDLTDTQQSVLAMVFKYCDDRNMPLVDFHDLREVLHYLGGEGKGELKNYGGMSSATVGVLIRKMVELEQQGAEQFFGEPELDINDLLRTDANGRGIVNILTLSDVQDKPRLFSTFLMWLLGQFYYDLPEVGDIDKPKLVFFFDEAHLLFEDASAALTEHIEQVARLIRSKGIGVFFITQTPKDVDEDVLAQLGNRVQHAVRAFTPKDAKNLKATASTFPPSEHYDITKTLTSLGIGEALVTVLNPKGIPTPVSIAQILPPASSMTQLAPEEYKSERASSQLHAKYATPIDRESAKEILQRRLEEARAAEAAEPPPPPPPQRTTAAPPPAPRSYDYQQPRRSSAPRRSSSRRSSGSSGGIVGDVLDSRMAQNVARQATRTIVSAGLRGLFGLLKK